MHDLPPAGLASIPARGTILLPQILLTPSHSLRRWQRQSRLRAFPSFALSKSSWSLDSLCYKPVIGWSQFTLSVSTPSKQIQHNNLRSTISISASAQRPLSTAAMNSTPVKAVSKRFSRQAGWGYPATLFPLPDPSWPPRVEHLLVKGQNGTAVDELAAQLELPRSFAEGLITFGAVHYAQVMPPPPPNSDQSVDVRWSESTAKASEEFGLPATSEPFKLLMRVLRLQDPFRILRQGGYLRVHVHPKRFPRAYEVDWRRRVLEETADFVILDKPSGVPVQGTVDNLVENCAARLSAALQLEEPLKVTHRLDVGSEGCLVLAKTPAFLRDFNALLAGRKVHKTYRALAAARPPLGRLLHWTQPKSYAPRILSDEPRDGWLPCELEILAVEEVRWPTTAVGSLPVEDGGWPQQAVAYECTIRLITGRTHQVRAQLAHVGCPLIGDTMYMPGPAVDRIAGSVPSTSDVNTIFEKLSLGVASLHCSLEDGRIYGADPNGALGLQAWKLRWDGAEEEYVARTPWWREQR